MEERDKEVNVFSRLYAFVKKLFCPNRKPRDLKINWVQMKLDQEEHPISGQEKYK
mgnify:CR=1 FL=1